jgi:murein DD-endopeptidase MepM/ murein hydrolase activator NlpD
MFSQVKGLIAISFLSCAFLLVFSSCTSSPTPAQPTKSSEILLTPFLSPTPSKTPPVPTLIAIAPTDLPTPTPTPVVYKIVEGDTMLAIALRNDISLEELQAANPEVNPRLLSVGTELIIPLGEIIPENPMTATPVPVNIDRTKCYVVPDGVWCFLTVKNERGRELENLTARVVLYNNGGNTIAEGTAFSALNKLPADTELPLVIFFPGSISGGITTTSSLLSAQLVPKNDDRYLNAWLEVEEMDLAEDGLQAIVNGTFGLPKKSSPGNTVWIVGVAYDREI